MPHLSRLARAEPLADLAGKRLPRVAVIGVRGIPNVIGGIEAHCERLYPALAESCRSLEFWMLTRSDGALGSRRTLGGVRIRSLWSPRSRAEAAINTLVAIFYARLRLHASLVHLHGIGPAFFSPLVKILGMQLVVTHHAQDYRRPKWGIGARTFLKLGERAAARHADQIICVSATLRAEFLASYPEAANRTVTITHGLSPDWGQPVKSDLLQRLGLTPKSYALAVGRLDKTKRFHDLIAAKQSSVATGLPIVIAGDTLDRAAYASTLRQTSCPNVTFIGDVHGDDLKELYRNAALLVHPSEMEGFGLVILEALASGIPVLASDIPVHREFGLPEAAYFPLGDVRRISSALTNPESVPRADTAALNLLERFEADAKVRQHAEVLSNVLAASTKGRTRLSAQGREQGASGLAGGQLP